MILWIRDKIVYILACLCLALGFYAKLKKQENKALKIEVENDENRIKNLQERAKIDATVNSLSDDDVAERLRKYTKKRK